MKCLRSTPAFSGLVLMFLLASQAEAALYTFEGEASGGKASGTMLFSTTGPTTELVIQVENTSDPDLINSADGSLDNYPGIAAFGFDAYDPVPTVTYWKLEAFDKYGQLQTIGSATQSEVTVDIQGEWTLAAPQQNVDGIRLDFQPNQPGGAQGLLYNPVYMEPSTNLGALPNFFTNATLTMQFSSDFLLKASDGNASGKNGEGSPVMRFQRVGENQSGSLKLVGTLDESGNDPGGVAEVPEPATLAVWSVLGLSVLGGGALRRGRREK